jgi:hypothetical protein
MGMACCERKRTAAAGRFDLLTHEHPSDGYAMQTGHSGQLRRTAGSGGNASFLICPAGTSANGEVAPIPAFARHDRIASVDYSTVSTAFAYPSSKIFMIHHMGVLNRNFLQIAVDPRASW